MVITPLPLVALPGFRYGPARKRGHSTGGSASSLQRTHHQITCPSVARVAHNTGVALCP